MSIRAAFVAHPKHKVPGVLLLPPTLYSPMHVSFLPALSCPSPPSYRSCSVVLQGTLSIAAQVEETVDLNFFLFCFICKRQEIL